jgi:hypothetical protein
MATRKSTGRHHPDVQRDFETGTVNPGPGMAPPHRADDKNPGQSENRNATEGQQKQRTRSATNTGTEQGKGNCGCG